MTPNTYCIIQESLADQQHILSLLLSIELYSKNATCVVCCTAAVQTYLVNFPKKINLTLDFILLAPEAELHCLNYIKNIFQTLKYCVKVHTSCVHVSKDLIMTNALELSAEVLAQGIGFVKKTVGIVSEEKEYMRYTLNLCYVSDLVYVEKMEKYLAAQLNCECFADYTFNLEAQGQDQDQDQDEVKDQSALRAQVDQCILLYAQLPLFLSRTCDLTAFLADYSYVGSEDFFAYESSVNINEIDKQLVINGKPIAFCGVRIITAEKTIQQLNTHFLKILARKNVVYMSLINLKFSDKKLQFVVPNPAGVGIWDRTLDLNGGFYELVDIFTENYSPYVSQVEAEVDYFSFGNYVLTDKPSHIWLNNTLKKYSGMFICNYDKSLIDALASLPMSNPAQFLTYYTYAPKVVEAYLDALAAAPPAERTNDIVQVEPVPSKHLTFTIRSSAVSEEVDFQGLLAKLQTVKYGRVKNVDVNLIATYLAVGVVPVITDTDVYDLVENVHYLTSPHNVSAEKYQTLQQNGLNYYRDHIRPAACLNKLFEHIFIRNFD